MAIICAQCKHFRRVRPPSQPLAVAIGTTDAAISNALTKMGEDEQKQKEEEAAYKKQQALTDRKDVAWATRPVMSEYCALGEAAGEYLIAEVKNRDHECADFEAGRPELHRCTDCPFRVAATGNAIDAKWEKTFADSSLMSTAVHASTSTSDNLLNNYREGIGPRKAFEITGAYQSKGIMAIKPVYLDYCGKLSNEDGNEFVVCILQNSHQACQYWQRKGASEAEAVADNDRKAQAAATKSSVTETAPTKSERVPAVPQALVGEPESKTLTPPASSDPHLAVEEMVTEEPREHSTIAPVAPQPETAGMVSPVTPKSATKQSDPSRQIPGRQSRQRTGSVAPTIGNTEAQERQAPAKSQQLVLEPDPSKVELVPGNPPLTQELVNLVAAYWEWALDIKLDAQGRAILQQDCVNDWMGKNKQEAIESVANVIQTFELLNQSDESARVILHEQIWVSMIIGMQDVRSNFMDWLAQGYYAANPPLAPGQPPLTRKMSDATLEAFNFLAHLEPFVWEKELFTPRRARDSWARNLASTYAKLPPEQQQFYAQMPALWAILCENWRGASPGERDWLIAQWHRQIPWWTRDWSDSFRSQMMEEHAKADATRLFRDPNEPDPYEPSPFIPSLRSSPPTMPRMDGNAPIAGAPVAGMSPGASSRASEDAFSEALHRIGEEAAQDEGRVAETPEEAMDLQNRAVKRGNEIQYLSNMMQIQAETTKGVIQNLRV